MSLDGSCLNDSRAAFVPTTSSASLLLPLRSEQRVLDVAFLLALDVVGPGLVKDPDEAQARLLHHASRRDVHDHRGGNHTLNAKLGEALVDQRPRAFGRITLSPRRSAQPVAELDFVRGAALLAENGTTHESTGDFSIAAQKPYPAKRS